MSDTLLLAALARLETGQSDILNGVASLRGEVASLRAEVAALDAKYDALDAKFDAMRADIARLDRSHTTLRVDLMARMDRLQNNLNALRDDIAVNYGASDAVKRANDNTREELRGLGDIVSARYRKVIALEARVRQITGDP
jgi:hypothetical protein